MRARRPSKDTLDEGRVADLSDGVFAFAITLLVLTIARPSDYSDLARQLLDRWPSFATFVLAFLVIGIMWLNHHTVLSYVQRIDHGFYYRNLFLLMTVVILPYPTEVFGEALRTGAGEPQPSSSASSSPSIRSPSRGYGSTPRRNGVSSTTTSPKNSGRRRPSSSWSEPRFAWAPSESPS